VTGAGVAGHPEGGSIFTAQTGAPAGSIGLVQPTPSSSAGARIDAQATLVRSGVSLHGAIDAIHATLELAARRGIAQARIALVPEGLGEIRIHLSQTAQGLLARVSAQSAAAAQTLASGHAELRQSLDSIGVSLLNLQIGSFGHPDARERREHLGPSLTPSGAPARTRPVPGLGGLDTDLAPQTRALLLTGAGHVLAEGALVDVLV
jgi:hypothetical protein